VPDDKSTSDAPAIHAIRTGHASKVVSRARACGELRHQPCERCGATPVHAHHDDYTRPLDVRWLCPACHRLWHRDNSPRYIPGWEEVVVAAGLEIRPPGRPTKDPRCRQRLHGLRFSNREWAVVVAAAAAAGLAPAVYVREAALDAAKEQS